MNSSVVGKWDREASKGHFRKRSKQVKTAGKKVSRAENTYRKWHNT
jgi:hypothetical protein